MTKERPRDPELEDFEIGQEVTVYNLDQYRGRHNLPFKAIVVRKDPYPTLDVKDKDGDLFEIYLNQTIDDEGSNVYL